MYLKIDLRSLTINKGYIVKVIESRFSFKIDLFYVCLDISFNLLHLLLFPISWFLYTPHYLNNRFHTWNNIYIKIFLPHLLFKHQNVLFKVAFLQTLRQKYPPVSKFKSD